MVIGEMSMERPEIPGNRKKSIEEKQVFIWAKSGFELGTCELQSIVHL